MVSLNIYFILNFYQEKNKIIVKSKSLETS